MMVLGINDPWIWSIYILIILSALLCVVYGAINWNKGDDDEDAAAGTSAIQRGGTGDHLDALDHRRVDAV